MWWGLVCRPWSIWFLSVTWNDLPSIYIFVCVLSNCEGNLGLLKQNQTTIYSKKRKQRLTNHDWVFCQQSQRIEHSAIRKQELRDTPCHTGDFVARQNSQCDIGLRVCDQRIAWTRTCQLEHSNSRFESIRYVMRIDSFCKKKSAFRFTSCHAVFAQTPQLQ